MQTSNTSILEFLKKKILEEKMNKDITKLSQKFIFSLTDILKTQGYKSKNIESKIKNLEQKYSKILIKILFLYRINKLNKIIRNNLTNFPYLSIVKNFEDKIISKRIEKMKLIFIKSKETIPIFIADDGYNYGPFKENDIVFISENVSSILIKKKLAREIG